MRAIAIPNNESSILDRVVGSDRPNFSSEVAEAILSLKFDKSDRRRMEALAQKAREGKLTGDEGAELEAYARVRSLLGILKSKARRSLDAAPGRESGKRTVR